MHNELTEQDLRMMREELDHRRVILRPQLLEAVKEARAFGDLSENFEYKAAKQEKNRNESRIRFLENMIKTAVVISDHSGADQVGLYDRVTVYMEDDDETEVYQIVTTMRQDVLKGLISKESPVGRRLLGRRVGDRVHIQVNESYGYDVVIRAIEKGTDDGEIPLNNAKKSSDGKTALPSYLIRNVRRMFPDVRITDADRQDGQFVYLKIPKQDIEWNTENYIKTLSENAALLLYGTQLKGSISAFETYASCRFAYFLEYGLKLSQREEYRFAVQDFGTVLHGVLEDVSRQLKEEKKSFSLLSDEERKKRVSESVVRIAAEYGNTILKDNSRNEYMIKRLTDLADRTVWAIGKQLERGEFAPDAYEMNFLVDEHEVLGDKSLYMQGKIDRIDICEDDNNVYVRVVDYKTGKSDFDLLKTFYGLKLQLVTYMKAAQRIEKKRHPDKNIIPAGILYYNIDNPIIEVQSMPDEEDADYREAVDEMILENLRMKGVVNEDTEIIRKMDDRGGKSAVIPVAFKSNGELDMRSHIYSTQKFEQLTDYVTEKSADMAAGIFGGNVDVNPYHTQKEDACTYCPYHAVCGFSPDIPGGQSRSLKTFSDEEIWKKIREGVDENGKPLDRKTVQGNPDKRL